MIGEQRVYGKKFAYGSFGPTDIPSDVYKKNKNILEEAEYTKEWLDKNFNNEFPNISFKLSRLYQIDIDVLIQIASCVGINYLRNKKVSVQEKRTLCRAIHKMIC
jgi:hypothetical protein